MLPVSMHYTELQRESWTDMIGSWATGRCSPNLLSPWSLNGYGSEVIGDAITPFVQETISREGYRRLPWQKQPVVMNVKGASASGKSTMRPLQRTLARKLHFRWEEFALISPDIWRKFLLD